MKVIIRCIPEGPFKAAIKLASTSPVRSQQGAEHGILLSERLRLQLAGVKAKRIYSTDSVTILFTELAEVNSHGIVCLFLVDRTIDPF
jgi:hypothetical protein